MAGYKMPGEFIYNGMVFNSLLTPAVLDSIPNFQFQKDDVLIATYPKTGTTWIQQITWLILNNVDIATAKRLPIDERSPFLEHSCHEGILNMEVFRKMKPPRLIKTHLYKSFFTTSIDKAGDIGFKIVVGMRNPKDMLVSFYHFYRMSSTFGNFTKGFSDFFDIFQAKHLKFGDFFDHVLSWWQERENQNVYFVKYEDLKADPSGQITKLAAFLGKTLSDMELDAIIRESTFDSMKDDPMANYTNIPTFDPTISPFIRKGEIGDWKNYFTDEQRQYVDERCVLELEPHGLKFDDVPLNTKLDNKDF